MPVVLTGPGWIADHRRTWGHVPRHHASCSDHRVVADRDAGQDHRPAPDPDILADPNRPPELQAGARSFGSRGWSAVRICTPRPEVYRADRDLDESRITQLKFT